VLYTVGCGSFLTLDDKWSRAEFDNLFVKPAQAVNAYLSDPNYLKSTLKYGGQQKEQLERLVQYLVTNKPLTFEECIVWARLQFEGFYNNDIRQLLYSLPKDALTSTGQPFWSGPKRAPDPLTFNSNDVRFVYQATFPLTDRPSPFSPSIFSISLLRQTSTLSTMVCEARQINPFFARLRILSLSRNSLLGVG